MTEGAKEQQGRGVDGMSPRAAARLSWALWVLSVALTVLSLWLLVLNLSYPTATSKNLDPREIMEA